MSSMPALGGRYRLLDRLGEGGMSVVWHGHDDVLDRPVAVKVLAARESAGASSRSRILAEARAAARLSHPNISNVHDYGESPDETGNVVPYIVMELLAGQTLAARLREGPLPPRAALRICAQVASALAAAHRQGLVHRDVKPGNIMLTPSGPKVVDFGIAAAAGQPAGSTPEGDVWGTPAYVAPERLTDGTVLPASDVYGLGLVLYRALTGELPWRTDTVTELLDAHKFAAPAPLPPIDGLPGAAAALCHQCLAKDPDQRPTAEELARQLAAAGGWRAVSAAGDVLVEPDEPASGLVPAARDAEPATADFRRPEPARPRRGRRIAAALMSAAVLSLGVVGAFWLVGSGAGATKGMDGAASRSDPPTVTGAPGGGGTATDREPASAGPPPTSPVEHVVETPFGSLVVACDGSTASLVSSELVPGVSLFEAEPDAGPELSLELTALRQDVRVSVRCDAGEPVAAVEPD